MPTVPRKPLGPGGPEVPALALGSWNTWDRMPFDDAVHIIARATELGCPFFDVAHYDSGPHAEGAQTDVLFGQAVREAGLSRAQWQLCGKLWLWDYPRNGFTEQLATSFERIGVGYADAVVLGDYRGELELERVLVDVTEQIEEGSFECWGVNNWPYRDLRAAIDTANRRGLVPPTFAQLKYSLVRRSLAEGACYGASFEAGELGLQASDVFEGGVLLGNREPARKIGADVGGIRTRIAERHPELRMVADELETTPAQLAIAFCLANPATANVLFGVSSPCQFEANVGALQLLETVGAAGLRARTEDLWSDRHVRADGIW